jgi:hypothetical protein
VKRRHNRPPRVDQLRSGSGVRKCARRWLWWRVWWIIGRQLVLYSCDGVAVSYLDGGSRRSGADAGAMRFGCPVEVVTGGASDDNGSVIGKVGGGWDSSIWIC